MTGKLEDEANFQLQIKQILAQEVYMTERQITKGRGAKDLVKNIVMDWTNDNIGNVPQT
nr:11354_t:CDS:2 [Entrophospora candida]